MVPSCHPHLFWNRIAAGDSTSRGLSCAVIPSSFLELDCFPWFDFPCLGCTVMTASFLELDCFRWFKSLHFEWHCHAFLFLELFCSYCLSGTVMPSSFGKRLLPVPGLPTIEWCCHTIFIFSGTVMLSSSLETVWFQWFNFFQYFNFLQFKCCCHAVLVLGKKKEKKKFASSDLTSYSLSGTMPYLFCKQFASSDWTSYSLSGAVMPYLFL